MARSDMSDLEWEFAKVVLPNKTRCKKSVDDRRVINDIFYVMRTASLWLTYQSNTAHQPGSTIASTDGVMHATGGGSWTLLQTRITLKW